MYPPPIHDPAVATDAMHSGDVDELHAHATKTLAVMVAALDPDTRAKVANVSLDFEGSHNEVNAYATCGGYGLVQGDHLFVRCVGRRNRTVLSARSAWDECREDREK